MFVGAGALVLAVGFAAEPVAIPSDSMAPTLHPGDQVLVDKLGLRLTGVHRGDLVVGDIDGVLAVPREHVSDILRLALAKVEGEAGVRRMIETGESTASIFEKTGIM